MEKQQNFESEKQVRWYSNSTVQNTSEVGSRALVDWVEFTLKTVQDVQDVYDILALKNDDFRDCETGLHGYQKMYTFGHIKVLSDNGKGFTRVIMSGQGCREYETFGSLSWSELFALLLNFDVNFNRIDVALDDFQGFFTIDKLKRKIREGACRSKFKTAKEIRKTSLKDGSSKGDTIYFGSARSSIQIRFYNKLLERIEAGKEIEEGVTFWNRAEIQARDERAFGIAAIIAHESMQLGSVIRGILADYVNFTVKNVNEKGNHDTNKGRWKICKWRIDFLENTDKLPLTMVAPDRTIESSYRWIDHQAAPTLALLFEAFNQDMNMISELVKSGLSRLDKKHLDMLNRFRKLNGDISVDCFTSYKEKLDSRIEKYKNMSYEDFIKSVDKKNLDQNDLDSNN